MVQGCAPGRFCPVDNAGWSGKRVQVGIQLSSSWALSFQVVDLLVRLGCCAWIQLNGPSVRRLEAVYSAKLAYPRSTWHASLHG